MDVSVETRARSLETGLYGGIEAGGTKFVCAVGTGPEDVQAKAQFPTTAPNEVKYVANEGSINRFLKRKNPL